MIRLRAVGLCSAMVVAACSSSGAPAIPTPVAGVTASPSASPFVAVPSTSEPVPAGADSPDLLVLRRDGGSPDTGYAVVDGGSMEELFSLPVGVPSADWRTLYAVATAGATTTVTAIDPNGGNATRVIDVPGAWGLPTIGSAHAAAGLAGDGRVLVLVEPQQSAASVATLAPTTTTTATTATTTRFAIVTTDGSVAPRIIALPGSLEYDAIAPNGSALFVLQHVAGADPTHYVVRSVDLASGHLVDGNIVDKREAGEAMGGYAVTQVAGGSGMVFTVYRGPDGAFIHALDTSIALAFCIDLPGPEKEDEATAAAWGLTLDPGGRSIYASNGELGTVAQVDLDSFSVTRTSKLAQSASVIPAKFGSGAPLHGGQATLSHDGSTLYVIGGHGISTVRTRDLVSTGTIGPDRPYRALAIGSGGLLYAIDGTGTVSQVDPSTGVVAASGRGGSYSGIVAVIPGE